MTAIYVFQLLTIWRERK